MGLLFGADALLPSRMMLMVQLFMGLVLHTVRGIRSTVPGTSTPGTWEAAALTLVVCGYCGHQ
jgi:hypothetical protein